MVTLIWKSLQNITRDSIPAEGAREPEPLLPASVAATTLLPLALPKLTPFLVLNIDLQDASELPVRQL